MPRAEAAPSPGVFTFLLRVCRLPSAWSSASPRAGPPWRLACCGAAPKRHCTVPIPPPDRHANCWAKSMLGGGSVQFPPSHRQFTDSRLGRGPGGVVLQCLAARALRVTINREHWHSLNSMLLPAPTRPSGRWLGNSPRVRASSAGWSAGAQGCRRAPGPQWTDL